MKNVKVGITHNALKTSYFEKNHDYSLKTLSVRTKNYHH